MELHDPFSFLQVLFTMDKASIFTTRKIISFKIKILVFDGRGNVSSQLVSSLVVIHGLHDYCRGRVEKGSIPTLESKNKDIP